MAQLAPRARWTAGAIVAGLALAGATTALANASDDWQGAVTSVGAVIAAVATAWAAYEARGAALASADASRNARMALALHNRSWPHVHLWRAAGIEGAPWTWYVTIGSGRSAADLHMSWTIDGRRREAEHSKLEQGDMWQHPAHIADDTDAADLWTRVGNVVIEWQDEQALMRWRHHVTIAEGVAVGTPAPYGDDLTSNARTRIPFVNNGEPSPIW